MRRGEEVAPFKDLKDGRLGLMGLLVSPPNLFPEAHPSQGCLSSET